MEDINTPCCASVHNHPDAVKTLLAHMPDEDNLIDLAELYRIFGDSTRVRILFALVLSPLCVCDIAATLGMTVSAISHQLRILRSANLVDYRREGKAVIYSLSDEHVHNILAQGLAHVREPRHN